MAIVKVEIEDVSGGIRVSVKSDCDFPADTAKWTDAQQAAMAVHHNLGVALQDLADSGPVRHYEGCAINDCGECTCGAIT